MSYYLAVSWFYSFSMQYSHTKKIKRDDKHPFLNKNYLINHLFVYISCAIHILELFNSERIQKSGQEIYAI